MIRSMTSQALDQSFLNSPFYPVPLQAGSVYFLVASSYWKSTWCRIIGIKSQCLRSSVRNRKHIDTESILQLCLFIEHIFKILNVRSFFQLNDNADAFLGRLVGNIHNIVSSFWSLQDCRHHLRTFRYCAPIMVYGISVITSRVLSAFYLLLLLPCRGVLIFPCTGLINLSAVHLCLTTIPPVGKSGPLIYFINCFCVDLLIFHIRFHTHRSLRQGYVVGMLVAIPTAIPSAPLTRRFGTLHRKHYRLFFRLIKVWYKIDHILVKIGKIGLLGQLLQAWLPYNAWLRLRLLRWNQSFRARRQAPFLF